MKLKIPNSEVQELLTGKKYTYPKYSTQIMLLANQNSGGTRPKVVGQMSDLIQQFEGNTIGDWEKWYLERHPEAIKTAADKVMAMVELLKDSMDKIDINIVTQWVEDLVVNKTYSGLKFQEAILQKVSKHLKTEYKTATPADESKGIDGFINGKPVSIKPTTYQQMGRLNETIDVPIIYYEKKKSEIVVEFDDTKIK